VCTNHKMLHLLQLMRHSIDTMISMITIYIHNYTITNDKPKT